MFRIFCVAAVSVTAALLAACGGGGGGSGPGSTLPTVTPTASASPLVVSGTVTELTSGSALAGLTVAIGAIPVATSCLSAQTSTSLPCAVPASPLPTATTSATGTFALTVPAAGSYLLTVGSPPAYATLHRALTVTAGTALGTVHVAALTADEQAWFTDVNSVRATIATPTSFGNLVVDEYAEEQARKWAIDVTDGATAYSDAAYAPYQAAYAADAGALYAAAGVLDEAATSGGSVAEPGGVISGSTGYYLADQSWMAEKANCAGGNWQTCAFASNTGHYINLSNTDDVWIGVGEAAFPASGPQAGLSAYDVMIIQDTSAAGPTAHARVL